MKQEIELKASRVKLNKKIKKKVKLSLLILVLILLLAYVIMTIIYNNGNFSITLDKALYYERGIIVYDDPDYKVFRTELYAPTVESLDNISYKWLPDDLDNNDGGSHNGENYVVYTFFVENQGEMVTDYWSEIIIDDVIKNVDEAVRVRVYKNGEFITYAKPNKLGNPEPETIPFLNDKVIVREKVGSFKPGDINKYTVVIWLEGTDPDCTDNILGGEIKMHMAFNSEFIDD